jgi:hypothetical protein
MPHERSRKGKSESRGVMIREPAVRVDNVRLESIRGEHIPGIQDLLFTDGEVTVTMWVDVSPDARIIVGAL